MDFTNLTICNFLAPMKRVAWWCH